MKNTIEHFKSLIKAEQFILTGSYCLNILGLYDKKPKDLDIILVNPDATSIDVLERLKIENPDYPDSQLLTRVKHGDIIIDFFIEKNKRDVLELKDGTLLAMPKDVVKAKKSHGRLKDILQLQVMSEMFFTKEDLDKYLKVETNKYRK